MGSGVGGERRSEEASQDSVDQRECPPRLAEVWTLPSAHSSGLLCSGKAVMSGASCCLRDATLLCSWGRLLSRAASTSSSCAHLSSSSSKTPASVAFRRSPMRPRSVPDHSEFTQPLRPAILRFTSRSHSPPLSPRLRSTGHPGSTSPTPFHLHSPEKERGESEAW